MSTPAQVRSTASIEAFRLALLKFQQRVEDALIELDGQLRRAVDWIEHDRPAYWRQQVHNADDLIHDAKQNLARCLIYRATDDRPACREERAELKKAQARQAYCREKSERVRHWSRTLKHELFEYQGRVGHLERVLEHDIPRASDALRQILRQLESYQLERPPTAMELPEQYARDESPETPADCSPEETVQQKPHAAGD